MEKKSKQGDHTNDLTADDPTVELDILEQTISIEGTRELRLCALGLAPVPISRAWIREGNPLARNKRLTGGNGTTPSTVMWDYTAGRFDWLYEDDEVAHVLEGSAVIEDSAGVRRRLQTGDTFLFTAGSRYQWNVSNYVRKIAFSYAPQSPGMRLISRILDYLTAPFRRKPAWTAARDG